VDVAEPAAFPYLRDAARGGVGAAIEPTTLAACMDSGIRRDPRRPNLRLALALVAIALAFYVGAILDQLWGR